MSCSEDLAGKPDTSHWQQLKFAPTFVPALVKASLPPRSSPATRYWYQLIPVRVSRVHSLHTQTSHMPPPPPTLLHGPPFLHSMCSESNKWREKMQQCLAPGLPKTSAFHCITQVNKLPPADRTRQARRDTFPKPRLPRKKG